VTIALFMPTVDVSSDGKITCDWGSSLINWTDSDGRLHENGDDPDNISLLFDDHLDRIRAELRDNHGELANLVRPFFTQEATP